MPGSAPGRTPAAGRYEPPARGASATAVLRSSIGSAIGSGSTTPSARDRERRNGLRLAAPLRRLERTASTASRWRQAAPPPPSLGRSPRGDPLGKSPRRSRRRQGCHRRGPWNRRPPRRRHGRAATAAAGRRARPRLAQGGGALGRPGAPPAAPLDAGQHPPAVAGAALRPGRGSTSERGRIARWLGRSMKALARSATSSSRCWIRAAAASAIQQLLLRSRRDARGGPGRWAPGSWCGRRQPDQLDLLVAAQPGAAEPPAQRPEARAQARRLRAAQRRPG